VLGTEERRSRRTQIITRLYNEGWARGDFDLVSDLLAPKVVWTAIEGAPDAGTYMCVRLRVRRRRAGRRSE
jgi:ketosteroid isomerase-like protein